MGVCYGGGCADNLRGGSGSGSTQGDKMKRQKQKMMLVMWVEEQGFYVPCQEQPECITDTKEMIAWAKENIKRAGTYQIMRQVPGELVIEEKQELTYKFK